MILRIGYKGKTIGCIYSAADMTASGENTRIRFLTSIDSLAYNYCGITLRNVRQNDSVG